MILGLQKFIVFILVLLQFVAPLVHAHSDHSRVLEGFHLHGLEILGHKNNFNYCEDSKNHLDNHTFNHQHVIVSIAHGIKHKKTNFSNHPSSYPPQNFSIIKSTLFYYEINFSPQPVFFVNNVLINLRSPRAPPLYSFS